MIPVEQTKKKKRRPRTKSGDSEKTLTSSNASSELSAVAAVDNHGFAP